MDEPRFKIIFDELAKLGEEAHGGISVESVDMRDEIDEIDELRRLVLETMEPEQKEYTTS